MLNILFLNTFTTVSYNHFSQVYFSKNLHYYHFSNHSHFNMLFPKYCKKSQFLFFIFFCFLVPYKRWEKKKRERRNRSSEDKWKLFCFQSSERARSQCMFRIILQTDTLDQSHFHSFQLGKEPNLLTMPFSLQTRHLGSMFCLPHTAHRAAFQTAGGLAKPMSLPTCWPKGHVQTLQAHGELIPGSPAKLSLKTASVGIQDKVRTQKPCPAFTTHSCS